MTEVLQSSCIEPQVLLDLPDEHFTFLNTHGTVYLSVEGFNIIKRFFDVTIVRKRITDSSFLSGVDVSMYEIKYQVGTGRTKHLDEGEVCISLTPSHTFIINNPSRLTQFLCLVYLSPFPMLINRSHHHDFYYRMIDSRRDDVRNGLIPMSPMYDGPRNMLALIDRRGNVPEIYHDKLRYRTERYKPDLELDTYEQGEMLHWIALLSRQISIEKVPSPKGTDKRVVSLIKNFWCEDDLIALRKGVTNTTPLIPDRDDIHPYWKELRQLLHDIYDY